MLDANVGGKAVSARSAPAHHRQARPTPGVFLSGRVSHAIENGRMRAMGSVADKIAKKIISSGVSKAFDPASWGEGGAMSLESGFGDDAPALGEFAGLDPCHALYAVAQNVASLMAESISAMREAKDYARIVSEAEEQYLPSGPPISPLTVSYFTMWALFDVRFGSSRETMSNCILRIVPEFDCPSWLVDALEGMHQSRMGFFVHCGSEGEGVLLREVGAREIVSCTVPAGYIGCEGQIWFVRVLPPLHRSHRHIVFNTPYVFQGHPERAFVDYLGRELARMSEKKPPGRDVSHDHLMKYGPDPNHWSEYIFCAFLGYQPEAVFLTGIPDIQQSLPHASDHL